MYRVLKLHYLFFSPSYDNWATLLRSQYPDTGVCCAPKNRFQPLFLHLHSAHLLTTPLNCKGYCSSAVQISVAPIHPVTEGWS